MSDLKIFKEIGSAPIEFEADSIYIMRTGTGFDLYVTDMTGTVAHKINTQKETPESIKVLYELNENTNEFSDVLKEKLESILIVTDVSEALTALEGGAE